MRLPLVHSTFIRSFLCVCVCVVPPPPSFSKWFKFYTSSNAILSLILSISWIISKFHTLTALNIFVIVDFQTVLHIYCEGMFMIYLHPKFHRPSLRGLLVIIIKLKVKENICTATIFLFYILQEHCCNKSRLFFDDQFAYIIL
jgi:hypothetical protein